MSFIVTKTKKWKLFRVIIGLGIGAYFLVLSLKGIDKQEFLSSTNSISTAPLMIGLLVYLANFLLRTLRWKLLLEILGPTRFSEVTRVLFIGYTFNNILPARLGEIFRSVYAAKSFEFPIAEVIMTVFLERFCDFVMLLLFLIIGGLLLINFQSDAYWIIPLTSIGILIFAVIVIVLFSRNFLLSILKPVTPEYIFDKLDRMSTYLSSMNIRTIFQMIYYTIVIWVVEILSVYLLLFSVDVFVGIDFLLVLHGVSGLVTLAPTAPGYVGSLQFAFREVFEAYVFSPTNAILAASLIQFVYFGAVCIIGGLFIILSK